MNTLQIDAKRMLVLMLSVFPKSITFTCQQVLAGIVGPPAEHSRKIREGAIVQIDSTARAGIDTLSRRHFAFVLFLGVSNMLPVRDLRPTAVYSDHPDSC